MFNKITDASPNVSCGVNPGFPGLSPSRRQVAYALRTRTTVTPKCPLALHVLGLPLAFILSQDQTLHSKFCTHDTTSKGHTHFKTSVSYTLVYFIISKNKNPNLPYPLPLFAIGIAKVRRSVSLLQIRRKKSADFFTFFPAENIIQESSHYGSSWKGYL